MTGRGLAFSEGVRIGLALHGQPQTEAQRVDLEQVRQRSLWRGIEMADSILAGLVARQWWLLRAPADEPFVLGDAPVVATLAVGHDDAWRPLLSESAYVVAMPLDPSVALLIARWIPGGASTLTEVEWVNFLSWKWAEEYVVARTEEELARVRERFGAAAWSASAPASLDRGEALARGVRLVTATVLGHAPSRLVLQPSLVRLRHEVDHGLVPPGRQT